MRSRFDRDARQTLTVAQQEAGRRQEARIGSEHLLFGVASAGEPVTRALHLTPERMSAALERRDARALHAVGIQPPGEVSRLWLPFVRRRRHLRFTSGAKQALERALRIALDEGHRRIGSTHVLAGLALGGANDPAVRLLRSLGVEPAELEATIRRHWRAA